MGIKMKISILTFCISLLICGTASAANISGQVRDARRGPGYETFISGVRVFLKDNASKSVVTNGKGEYIIENVADGEHFVVFEKSGLVTDMKKITAAGNEVQKLDMALVQPGLTTISDERFFNNELNLDFPGLEKVKAAVQSRDLLLAKYELIEYYRNRKTPVWNVQAKRPSDIKIDKSYSTLQVDLELAHNFTNGGITANTDDVPGSGNIDWKLIPAGDREWMWGINRMFMLLHFGAAWGKTLDSKYAYEYQAAYLDWIDDNPKPLWRDATGTWRTIEVGIRNHYPLPDSWYNLLYNDDVTTETRICILKSNIEHMEYLSSYMGGGNWLIFESRGLFTLATLHPEFKLSPNWKENALGRALAQAVGQFKPDGWQFEITPNYHNESTNSIAEIEKIANINNESTVLKDALEAAYSVENIIALPGGKVVSANDTIYFDIRGVMRNAAALMFNSGKQKGEDFLFTASDFRAGKPKDEDSHLFDYSGYVMLRDYWGPKNITAFFEGGPSGVGPHGFSSRDKLQLVVSAFGREMLIDTGVYSYTSEPIAKYMYTTQAHNTVKIDGYDQIRRKNGMDKPAKDVMLYQGVDFDYTKSIFNETYDEVVHLKAEHERKVFFDKEGVIFTSDLIKSEGKHKVEQFWNVAPCSYEYDKGSNKFTAKYDDGTGIIVIPVSSQKITGDVVAGQTEPLRGWFSSTSNCAEPIPNLRYELTDSPMPAAIDTVIVPYKGEAPKITVKRIEAKVDNISVDYAQAGGVKVEGMDEFTRYYLRNNSLQGNVSYDGFVFNGETALIIKDAQGKTVTVKRYPQDSVLIENSQEIGYVDTGIAQPKSGSIISTDTIKLSLNKDLGSEVKRVEYYARYVDENGEKVTQKIAESNESPFNSVWNVSTIQEQLDINVWAVVEDNNGRRWKTIAQREIELDRFSENVNRIELEDRAVSKEGYSLSAIEDGTSNKIAQVLYKGASVSRKIKTEKPLVISIKARKTTENPATLDVLINNEQQKIELKNGYESYELYESKPLNGVIDIRLFNGNDDEIRVDCLNIAGEDVEKINNMAIRHRSGVNDDQALFGEDANLDYEAEIKVKINNIANSNDEGGLGIVARYSVDGSYAMYYDDQAKKLMLRKRVGKSWSVLSEQSFTLDKSKWYIFKIKAQGNVISGKVWKADNDEPMQWMISITDNQFTQGCSAIYVNRVDAWVDDLKATEFIGEEAKVVYYNDVEGTLPSDRPAGVVTTKSAAWGAEDMRSSR